MPEIDYLTVFKAITPVFAIVALGMLTRWAKIVPAAAEDTVLKTVVNVLIPCLIFDQILGNEGLRQLKPLLWASGAGFFFVTILMLVGRALAGPVAGIAPDGGRGSFGVASGIQNYGFFAIPVLLELFPDDTSAHGLIFVHSLGVELSMWTLGVMLFSGFRSGGWKAAINIPLLCLIAALILNAFRIEFPPFLAKATSQLAAGAIPLGIFTIGFTTAGLLKGWRPRLQVGLAGSVIRLLLAPALFLTAIAFIPFPDPVAKVLVVQAAMPAAIFPIVLARLYGGRPSVAVEVAAMTTLLSILTMPLVLALGQALLAE